MHSSERPAARPLIRRDAEGGERSAPSWESLTERLIREAQDEGRFDDLPGHGRPLRLDDDSRAGDMAMAHHLLRNAGAVPPWIETDKQVRELHARIEGLLQQAERSSPAAAARLYERIDALADACDEATRRLESLAPTPRQQRARLDRNLLRSRLADAIATRPPGT